MNTKYDVGEKVLVEGIIKNVKADCTGLVYGIEFCGRVHNFSEDQIYSISIKGGADDKSGIC